MVDDSSPRGPFHFEVPGPGWTGRWWNDVEQCLGSRASNTWFGGLIHPDLVVQILVQLLVLTVGTVYWVGRFNSEVGKHNLPSKVESLQPIANHLPAVVLLYTVPISFLNILDTLH